MSRKYKEKCPVNPYSICMAIFEKVIMITINCPITIIIYFEIKLLNIQNAQPGAAADVTSAWCLRWCALRWRSMYNERCAAQPSTRLSAERWAGKEES
jgi:hypothetical protein